MQLSLVLTRRIPGTTSCLVQQATKTAPTNVSRRSFGTGPRGARGHGWYTKYRAGKGGRHLQGEYFDRSLEDCQKWNDAVLQLGCRQVYLDISVEPSTEELPTIENMTGERHRLIMDIASTVMPETTDNFIQLLERYPGSRAYRIEKNVGLMLGDYVTNTGKTGQASTQGSYHVMSRTIEKDPLAMWHVPGTVSMLVPTVDEIDSRFMLITQESYHLDGIQRAFGRLTRESLAIVQKLERETLTKVGLPTSAHLMIAECGLVDDSSDRKVA